MGLQLLPLSSALLLAYGPVEEHCDLYVGLVKLLPLCAACTAQLPADADAARVRKAYLLTIRKIHPDKLPGQPKVRERAMASALFDALRAAHEAG